jgi:hypothetical protein
LKRISGRKGGIMEDRGLGYASEGSQIRDETPIDVVVNLTPKG